MAWSDAARKAAAEARRRNAKSGKTRVAATIGRESMVMRKKDTPAQTAAKVAAAGARAKARRVDRFGKSIAANPFPGSFLSNAQQSEMIRKAAARSKKRRG